MVDTDASVSGSSSSSVDIHRLRFLPFQPSAPSALALSGQPHGSSGRGLLAVGRNNGDIDLCVWVSAPEDGLDKGWLPHTTLVNTSTSPRKVETLAFALTSGQDYGAQQQLRLFSISSGSVLTEHFLPQEMVAPSSSSLKQKHESSRLAGTSRSISSHGGVIWSMAASPLGRYIAIGCEDGHIRLVDIREDRFEHLLLTNVARSSTGSRDAEPRMDRAKSRVVSLAWGPPIKAAKPQKPSQALRQRTAASPDSSESSDSDDDDDELQRESFLLAGTTASVALVFNVSTGRASSRLLLPKARSEQTIVWSATVLPDGTLVTGDSLGFVTFYDVRTKVPLPDGRFQVHDKGADVLCLAVSPSGRAVYSGSVDQRVSEFAYLDRKWVHTATRRLHAHDVRSLIVSPGDPIPILISASADFNVVLTPAAPPTQVALTRSSKKIAEIGSDNPVSSNPITTFAATTQRRLPYVPMSSAGSSMAGSGAGDVQICSSRGWAVHRTSAAIEIWEASQALDDEESTNAAAEQSSAGPYRRLLQMEMTKRQSKLVAHAISTDGSMLAVSDLFETKMYGLRSTASGQVHPQRLKSFPQVFGDEGAPAASALAFTQDGRLVMASWPGGVIYLVTISSDDGCKLVKAWSASKAVHGRRAVIGRRRSEMANETNGHGDVYSGESGDDTDDTDEDEPSSSKVDPPRIDLLVISSDSQYLICGAANHVWTYNLDLLAAHPRLMPSLRSRAVAIASHPTDPSIAVAAQQDGSIRVLHLDDTSSRKARWDDLVVGVQEKTAAVRDSPTGLCWSTAGSQPAVLVVHGASWILTAREEKAARGGAATRGKRDLEGTEIDGAGGAGAGTKAKQNQWNVRITFRYQPLVHVAPFKPQGAEQVGLAVVEKPFFELAKGLDAAWRRQRRYGQ